MKSTLLLVWRFEEKGQPTRTQTHDFAADGEMSVLCREIASHIEIVDGGRAFFEGVIGDLEGQVLRLRSQLDFWIGDTPVLAEAR